MSSAALSRITNDGWRAPILSFCWCLRSLPTQVLAEIFGKAAASSIVYTASNKKGLKRKLKSSGGDAIREAASRAKALAASRTVEVSEVKKFAGQEIV